MPQAALTSVRILLIVTVLVSTLSRVQTYAEATVTEKLSTASPTPAQAISSNSATINPANSWAFPKECHPWARFQTGSWREIEITTETFDEQDKVFGRSITTQKEALKAVADDSYVIEVQATVDVAGKRIAGPWNTRVLRLSTDRTGTIFSYTQKKNELLHLNVGNVKCQVFELQYSDESKTLCDLIYFSPEIFPYVLQRNTFEQSDNNPASNVPEDITTLVARSVPLEWEGKMIECVSQQTLRRREKGESQTLSMLSPEIPGGEIRSHSTDFDTSGHRIRWSVQRLVAYGTTHTTGGREAPVPSGPTVGEPK